MNTLAPNIEAAQREVQQLAAGELTRTPEPRRRITYRLTRAGRPLLRLGDVQNPYALPLGLRLAWKLT